MPEQQTVTKWLATIATTLVVAGLSALPIALIYNEQRAQRHDTNITNLQTSRNECVAALRSIDDEFRRPGGIYHNLEDRVRKNEQRLTEEEVLRQECVRRVTNLETKMDGMWNLVSGHRP